MRVNYRNYAVGCLCWLVASPTFGGVLEVEPTVSTWLSYDDNPTLLPEASDPQATFSTTADLKVKVEQRAPDTTLSVTPQIRRIEYAKKRFEALNATEYLLDGEVTKQFRTATAGSTFRFTNQTVLSAEDSDPEDPGLSSSGNFLQRDERVENLSFSPYVNVILSQRDMLTFSGFLSRVDQIKRFSPLADYNIWQSSVSYQRTLTERHFLGLEISAGRTNTAVRSQFCSFFPIGPTVVESCKGRRDFLGRPSELYIVTGIDTQEIISNSAKLTYQYRLTDKMNLRVKYGLQKTRVNQLVSQSRPLQPGFVQTVPSHSDFDTTNYLVAFDYAQRRTNWLLEITREVQPTSNGDPTDKTQARAIVTYRLMPKMTAKLAAIYYKQNLRGLLLESNNKFLRTDLTLTRRITQKLSTDAIYIYREQKPVTTGTAVVTTGPNTKRKSNNLIIQLRYRF